MVKYTVDVTKVPQGEFVSLLKQLEKYDLVFDKNEPYGPKELFLEIYGDVDLAILECTLDSGQYIVTDKYVYETT